MSKKVQIQRVKELYHCAGADDSWTFPLQALCKKKRRTVTCVEDTLELWPIEIETPEDTKDELLHLRPQSEAEP